MPPLCYIFHVLSLIVLFTLNVQGQIYLPLGNVTYWSAGSHVHLPWKYNFNSTDILLILWRFTSSKASKPENVAIRGRGDADPEIKNPLFNVTDLATLEFRNADIRHNGTYSLEVTLSENRRTSKVVVIILKKPTAVTCSKKDLVLKEGESVHCWCNGTNGNPPPTASWSRNGTAINGTGYLTKMLYLNNVTQEKTGVYNCTVRSHNLTDTTLITIKLKEKTKPTNMTFKIKSNDVTVGDSVVMTCEADAYPDPEYVIFFNGARLNRTHAGEYTISSSSLNHTGTYKCFAKNILGNISKAILLTVKAKEKTTVTPGEPSTPTEPLSTSSSTKKGGSSGGSSGPKPAVIAGIVVGVLFIITLIAIIVWFFCRGSNSRKEREVVSGASPSAGFVGKAENPYESVDAYKENEAGEDSGAGPSVNAPANNPGSSLPPVYAVVDKSKKTKKDKKEDALTYASLDPVALQPDSSKMRVRDHKGTDYAAIDLEKLKKNDV